MRMLFGSLNLLQQIVIICITTQIPKQRIVAAGPLWQASGSSSRWKALVSSSTPMAASTKAGSVRSWKLKGVFHFSSGCCHANTDDLSSWPYELRMPLHVAWTGACQPAPWPEYTAEPSSPLAWFDDQLHPLPVQGHYLKSQKHGEGTLLGRLLASSPPFTREGVRVGKTAQRPCVGCACFGIYFLLGRHWGMQRYEPPALERLPFVRVKGGDSAHHEFAGPQCPEGR